MSAVVASILLFMQMTSVTFVALSSIAKKYLGQPWTAEWYSEMSACRVSNGLRAAVRVSVDFVCYWTCLASPQMLQCLILYASFL